MTRQRPRKTQLSQPAESTGPQTEQTGAAAAAAATLAAEDHPQEAGGGGGSETDLTGAEPAAPVEPIAPVALAEGLTPEPAPAPPTVDEAQPRPPRDPRQPRPTKLARLQPMLRARGGASLPALPALREATGWQAHTLRAALIRLRQAGHAVERGRSDEGVTSYWIVDGGGQPAGAKAASAHSRPAPGDASAARGPA